MRAARNQVLFREVNERLRELNQAFAPPLPVADLVCECSNAECTERIGLTVEEYELLRADPTHFAVCPGHENPDLESVLEERSTYTLIEKRGLAADYVTRADPRARPPANIRRRRPSPS
jgi:hypothetical protein